MSRKNRHKKKAANRAKADNAPAHNAANSAPAKGAKSNGEAIPKPSWMNRRNALKALIAMPVAAVAGTAIHRYDVQNKNLHELSVIGQGKPVVVQVHDPSCQLCRRLMKNTRAALKNNPEVLYRVADMTDATGGRFQRQHNADKVTLVLFDSGGRKVDTLVGVREISELESRFAAL